MDALADLKQETREVANLVARIRDLCGDDDKAFVDTLGGSTEVVEAARRVVRWMIEQDAAALSCKGLAAIYEARAKMFAERHAKAKLALLDLLNDVGLKSMPLPEAALTAKPTPPKLLGEADPETLPLKFQKVTVTADTAAIKAALEGGEQVEGYMLSNGGQTLQMRVR
jgi:hypothetical protein